MDALAAALPLTLRREWLAYLDGPYSEQTRRTFRAGVVAAATFNAQGGVEKGKPAKAEMFFPELRRRRRERRQDPRAMIALMQAWAGSNRNGVNSQPGRSIERGRRPHAGRPQ